MDEPIRKSPKNIQKKKTVLDIEVENDKIQ